jgi:hypothetical protein
LWNRSNSGKYEVTLAGNESCTISPLEKFRSVCKAAWGQHTMPVSQQIQAANCFR